MNDTLPKLLEKIKCLKGEKKTPTPDTAVRGYNVAIVMMTDLLSCILVGLGIGLFLQKFFHTSVLLTGGLILLGGIAGLWSVIRFALAEEKRNDK